MKKSITLFSLLSFFIFTSFAPLDKRYFIEFDKVSNELGYKIFGLLAESKSNFCFSPYSITTCTGMALKGAKGNTSREIMAMLQIRDTTKFFRSFKNLYGNSITGKGSLQIANGIWAEKNYPFKASYINDIQKYFLAPAKVVDFREQHENCRLEINKWCSENTKGNIKEILPEGSLNTDTRLVTCNTIYFKDAWDVEFNKNDSQKGTFFSPKGQEQVNFMYKKDKLLFYEDEYIRMVCLPFRKERSIHMIIILPAKGKALEEIISFNDQYLSSCLQNLSQANVKLTMPSFKAGFSDNAKVYLQKLGMLSAFSEPAADFTNMDPSNNLFLSNAFHEAKIIVNEQGVEASAATAFTYEERSLLKDITMIVDRPFIFFIRNIPPFTEDFNATNYFMGRINNPNEE